MKTDADKPKKKKREGWAYVHAYVPQAVRDDSKAAIERLGYPSESAYYGVAIAYYNKLAKSGTLPAYVAPPEPAKKAATPVGEPTSPADPS